MGPAAQVTGFAHFRQQIRQLVGGAENFCLNCIALILPAITSELPPPNARNARKVRLAYECVTNDCTKRNT